MPLPLRARTSEDSSRIERAALAAGKALPVGMSAAPPLCESTIRNITKGRPLSKVNGVSIFDFSRPTGKVDKRTQKQLYDWCCPNCEKVYKDLSKIRKKQWDALSKESALSPDERKMVASRIPLTEGMPEGLRKELDVTTFRYITTGEEGKIHVHDYQEIRN